MIDVEGSAPLSLNVRTPKPFTKVGVSDTRHRQLPTGLSLGWPLATHHEVFWICLPKSWKMLFYSYVRRRFCD